MRNKGILGWKLTLKSGTNSQNQSPSNDPMPRLKNKKLIKDSRKLNALTDYEDSGLNNHSAMSMYMDIHPKI